MSNFQSYRTLVTQYSMLVPPEVEGLVVVWLYEKVAQEEIDKNFIHSDIERAIQEVTVSLALENKPRTENILTPLLHHFIENLGGNYERYALTEYAKKFVRLIQDKLNSPHKHFPLRQSFEKYAQFKAGSVHTIEDFESWFRQGFDNTTRQTILDHLESLQDNVRSARNELNRILSSESEQSALQMAYEFTKTFNILGEKADEIRDTLTLDFGLKQEIRSVVDMFHARLETSYLAGRDAESNPTDLEEAYQKASDIQKQVNTFFSIVKEKLEHIRRQIIFASGKLNELQEHFRYQSRFKVNLRKMLTLAIKRGAVRERGLNLT